VIKKSLRSLHRKLRCLHVSSYGPTAAMKTDVLQLQIGCGTTFQLFWDKLISALNSLNGCWKHFFGCWERGALWLTV